MLRRFRFPAFPVENYWGVEVLFGGIVVESGEVDGVELGVAVVPVDGLTPVDPAAPAPGVPVVDGEFPFTVLVPLVEPAPETPVVPLSPFGLVDVPEVVPPTAEPV
jgi:hypothetical protein